MPLWIAGAVLGSSLIASKGASNTNDTNMDISSANSAFNAEEALKNREFLGEQGQITREYNTAEAQAGREFNMFEANVNRNWQQAMSNTAHQREMGDLARAGLNPILAARGGASTPAGASASSGAASAGNVGGSQASAAANPHLTNVLGVGVDAGLRAFSMAQEGLTATQNRGIKAPLEQVSDYANKGIDAIVGGVSKSIEPLVRGIEEARAGIAKLGSAASTAAASSLDRVQAAVGAFAEKATEAINVPKKFLDTQTNSAKDYFDSATAASRRTGDVMDRTFGKTRFKFDKDAFTGDVRKDIPVIMSIKDPVSRSAVRFGYRQWRDHFQK